MPDPMSPAKERAHKADPALDAPRGARTIVVVPFVEARKPDRVPDRVGLVAPGTYAVRGFSMIGKRLHG